jgi:riboflavin synthase
MFSGIVERVGKVEEVGKRLVVEAEFDVPFENGESVAINGCCLTHIGGDVLCFELSDETLSRTNLGMLQLGDCVNIERALRIGDRLGGHFVSGHVDALGELLSIRQQESGSELRFAMPSGGYRYLVDKGSVTIDGVSLTVVHPSMVEFSVWCIPFTLQNTTLGLMSPGRKVNIEFDLISKYLEGLLSSRLSGS